MLFQQQQLVLVLLLISSLNSSLSCCWAMSSSVYPAIQTPRGTADVGGGGGTTAGGDTTTTYSSSSYPGILNYVHRHVHQAHIRRSTTGDDDNEITATTTTTTTTSADEEDDTATTTNIWQPVELMVHNARQRRSSPNGKECHLDREGCTLVNAPLSSSSSSSSLDFLDSAQVVDEYYAWCEDFLQHYLKQQQPGNNNNNNNKNVQVWAFDHNIRMAAVPREQRELRHGGGSTVQGPLGVVHGDYTAISAPRRLHDLAHQPPKANDVWRHRTSRKNDDHQASLLDPTVVQQALAGKRRYAVMNIWRSIDTVHPVTSYPLAFVNAQTVTVPDDVRTLQIHYTDRVGENYLCVAPSEQQQQHEWLFYPRMTFDEVLLIKQWDSAGKWAKTCDGSSSSSANEVNKKDDDDDNTVSTFCIHSAFGLPSDAEPNPQPRKSIEVRCVCIWDADEE